MTPFQRDKIVKEKLKKIEKELKILQNSGDIEESHSIADSYLMEALTLLGCNKIVEEYDKVDKWYA